MIPVAAIEVFAQDALGEASQGFAIAYMSTRTMLTIMWMRGGWHEKSFRPVSNVFAIGFTIAITFFLVSLFVDPPLRIAFWGIGLFIDLITPYLTLEQQVKLPRFSSSRLPERFGLFTIIVLGESIVGAVSGIARNVDFTVLLGGTGLLGLALAFGIWWVYFDFVARRPPKPGFGGQYSGSICICRL